MVAAARIATQGLDATRTSGRRASAAGMRDWTDSRGWNGADGMTTTSSPAERTGRLLALAGELADDFATRADEHDRENTFPFENFEKLKSTGYITLPVPE